MKDRTNMLSGRRLTALLAFNLVVIGILELYINYMHPYDYEPYNVLDRLGYALMMITGTVMMFSGNQLNVVQKIGYSGIVIGIALVMDRSISLWLAFVNRDVYTASMMLYAYVQFIVAVLLVYFAVRYLLGNIRDGVRMALVTALSVILVLYFMLFALINRHMAFDTYLDMYLPDTVALFLYTVFIFAIFTPGAYESGSLSGLRVTLDGLASHTNTPQDSTILRSDLLALEKALEDPESWGYAQDGTPFREYRVRIGARKDSAKVLVLRRSEESFRIRVLVVNLAVSESVQSTRFDLLCLTPLQGETLEDCGMVRIYGNSGFFADILVEDAVDSYKPDIMDRMMEIDRRKDEIIAEWKRKIWQ